MEVGRGRREERGEGEEGQGEEGGRRERERETPRPCPLPGEPEMRHKRPTPGDQIGMCAPRGRFPGGATPPSTRLDTVL